ncbi:hypothetical protein P4C99_11015 [Pontiellaceae bacterium B1224]|nr:hypothetical protein [Pontiellaceae bacterium B1224]
MPVDFKINLAKDLTSSTEERTRFYNGMLIYLLACAVLLVFVAYTASSNLRSYMKNKAEQQQLRTTAFAVAELDPAAFKNPGQTYNALDTYSRKIASLKQLLGQRVQLLPVVHNLFLDLPSGVALQSLSANTSTVSFGLVMPPPSQDADPVRDLREAWEKNEELMKRVVSIRPVTGERRTMGEASVFFVQFECVLKK